MELQIIQSKIYEIRGMRVMLDYDLSELYQVETKKPETFCPAEHRPLPTRFYDRTHKR